MTRVAAALVLVVTLLVGAPERAGGQAGCQQPYEPYGRSTGGSGGGTGPDAFGDSLQFVPPPADMDGDGRADEIVVDYDTPAIRHQARVVRGDGELVLRSSDEMVLFVMPIGDLDGDGRDELYVVEADYDSLETAPKPEVHTIVPGTTPPGTADPRDVGFAVTDMWTPGSLASTPGVGDQDGDGADDVAWVDRDGQTQAQERFTVSLTLLSGRDVMAARSIEVEPIRVVADVEELAALGEPAPTFITSDVSVITVHLDEPVTLTGPITAFARALRDPRGHRIVISGASTRSGWDHVVWDLDDPCARWSPAAIPPSQPATPVDAEPSYTG